MRKGTGIMKTPKPLLALRMVFPLAASLIVLLLGEGIARGSLSADVFASFIFPHIGAYLLAWLLLFLVWLLLDWVFRCPPLSTLGMAVLGCYGQYSVIPDAASQSLLYIIALFPFYGYYPDPNERVSRKGLPPATRPDGCLYLDTDGHISPWSHNMVARSFALISRLY